MPAITIGKSGTRKVPIDVATLLKTRLLIQANSGGGKSWALRRLAEELFGKVQVFLIDRDGEFSTLREEFGFVLAGQGGDTPADIRSARLLAEKLLELNASAVLDVYEAFRSRPADRRAWVRGFLESLMDAPRKLWRPLVVIVDEAHQFCPESLPKAASPVERENISGCKDAMVSLATAGRKRGFCAVWATQRLAKLDKDASAELLNRLVGMTIEDVDVDRAVDLMSVSREERQEFKESLRNLEPGNFYGFGRAIAKVRTLIKVGPVLTTHPEPGSQKYGDAPPPPPEKIRALLPKLSDLPKEVETKAKTEAELRQEIRALKAQIAAKPIAAAPRHAPQKPSVVQVPVLKPAEIARIERALEKCKTMAGGLRQSEAFFTEFRETIGVGLKLLRHGGVTGFYPFTQEHRVAAPKEHLVIPKDAKPVVRKVTVVENRIDVQKRINGNLAPGGLTAKQIGILKAMSEFRAIGVDAVPRTWISVRSGASHRSSAYKNNLGTLRSCGFVEYLGDKLRMTEKAIGTVPPPLVPVTKEEAYKSCIEMLSNRQADLFKIVYEAYPEGVEREELATRAGVSPTSSAFKNNCGAIRSAGMFEYVGDKVRCSDWMFFAEAVPV